MAVKVKSFWVILFLLAVVVAGVFLAGKRQEIRKSAYFSGVKVTIQPEVISADMGKEVPVQLWLETDKVSGSDDFAKVSSADITMCFGSELVLDEKKLESLIELNQEAFKTLVMASLTKKGANESCLKIVALSTGMEIDKLKSGIFRVATIKFTPVREGTGKIDVPQERVFVAGYNPMPGSADSSLAVGSVMGTNYDIGGSQKTSGSCFFLWRWLGWCR
ncbi:MAG: hypothetical protein WC841_04215 [Candidatus Shapirobacteria bacterium]|jgi:hypothetical protein